MAGPGFINFKVKDEALMKESLSERSEEKNSNPEKIMVEFTDPNPFKIIHIGHLMSNTIGESIARLIEYGGAIVKRANWQGDVGLHVAKTIWGVLNLGEGEFRAIADKALVERVDFLGRAYVKGNDACEESAEAKKEIEAINKKIFEKSDPKIQDIYEKGRQWSLDYFETIYERLGTKFDYYFFEGREGVEGKKIVEEHIEDGIFEKSEGATIFKGEKYGLHTRVFINSQGLPTYEAKELGLNHKKFEVEKGLSKSIIVTGNEITDYFKVLMKVIGLIYPDIAKKTLHIPHGMLRFASGKMSSRKGNVISAESLVDEIREQVKVKIADRIFTEKEADEISDMIAVAAIKFSILRAAIGGDIIFDSASSISFEGDSGPYLQYSVVRANSILNKAREEGIANFSADSEFPKIATPLEKLLIRFQDIAERAKNGYSPQHVANYLINLASAFNGFYASQIIVDRKSALSPYYVVLTKSFVKTMTDGLWILGIKVPPKM